MDDRMKKELARTLADEQERLSKVKVAHIVYNDGRTVDGRICATFDSEDTNYMYFIFTDNSKTSDGLYVVYAARYDVINSVLFKTGFELTEKMEAAEVEMIRDVIDTTLVSGVVFKKPACFLKIGGIKSVTFE